jgi:Tfp pilus assembly protein PilF
LLFGSGSYVVLLVPVLGFVDMALLLYTPIADHWQHLAAPALLALVAAGAGTLTACMTRSDAARLVWPRLLGGALVAFLAVQTWRRVDRYRDDEALWRDAVAAAPTSGYAQASLGTVLFEQGRREQARPFYLEAIRLEPDHRLAPLALHRLAVMDLDEGRPELAVRRLERALALEPRYVGAHQLIAGLLLDASRPGDAAPHVEALLSHSGLAAITFGRSLVRLGSPAPARRILSGFFGTALEARARAALGYSDIDAGDLTAAERELAEAVRLDPALTEGYLALAFIADHQADPARTTALLRRILELQPDNADAREKLRALGQAPPQPE